MAGLTDFIMKWVEPFTPQLCLHLAAFCVCAFLMVGAANSQISPGELHQAHISLEGLDNCNKCHDPERKNMADNCLSCHTVIKQQQQTNKGIHAQKEFARCETCHVEHQGRNFELVHFEGGEKSFDHNTTGYKLEGKHSEVKCRDCHNPEKIKGAEELKKQSVSIERTFLGLKQDCLSCHFDEHRGQMTSDCLKCHTLNGWKPAPGFDHSQTKYPLTGKHQKVECAKCHHEVQDKGNNRDKNYLTYAPLKYNECTDCHTDIHNGKLGPKCTECHNTNGWGTVKMTDFDHNRTNFPLLGKHQKVECEKCHGGKSIKTMKSANCTDCHKDFHKGEFSDRKSKGACEECHNNDGFLPSTFTMLKHNETLFPLTGSHQAIACINCHVPNAGKNTEKEYHFSFDTLRCLECHKDPHKDQVKKLVKSGGCETCHRTESWALIKFDHNKTDYPLEGAHAKVPCEKCHKLEVSGKDHFMRYKPLDTKCSSCHSNHVSIERLIG